MHETQEIEQGGFIEPVRQPRVGLVNRVALRSAFKAIEKLYNDFQDIFQTF